MSKPDLFPQRRENTQKDALAALDAALSNATDCGLLDAIACGTSIDPDTVNAFCAAVHEMAGA